MIRSHQAKLASDLALQAQDRVLERRTHRVAFNDNYLSDPSYGGPLGIFIMFAVAALVGAMLAIGGL